jgi:hypothetical protein
MTMKPATDRGRGSRHRTLVIGLCVALSLAVYAAGIALYFAAQRGPAEYVKNHRSPVQLDAFVRTISMDPSSGDLGLRVEVRPGPGLVGSDGVSVTRPVGIDIVGGTGTASHRYGAGDRIGPIDVTIGTAGNFNSYPFDSYKSLFAVVASTSSQGSTLQGSTPSAAPTHFTFDGTLSGYHVTFKPLPRENADANTLALGLSIRRAPLTGTFAILIVGLQALLATAAAALALFIWSRHRRVEIAMLTWLVAMLFAIVPLRNAMPGAPPIGALVDVVIFFWAVTIIALSMVSVLVMWLLQPRRPNEPAADA